MLKGRKILLTGLTGRVGGAFADRLVEHNEIWGLARYSEPGSLDYWRDRGVHTIAADFGQSEFSDVPTDVDYVVHLAAWTGWGVANRSPDEAIRINAEATGLLMAHCREAQAFLHVSTCAVYDQVSDPWHAYQETDPVSGGGKLVDYSASKLAAEGAVRTLARVLSLPTVICRLNAQYGPWADCGLPEAMILRNILAGTPILLPANGPANFSLINNADLIDFVEPCLGAATVPAIIVNWGGDEVLSVEQMALFLGALVGIEPKFERTAIYPVPAMITDNSLRSKIAGPCKVNWKDGLREMVRFRHPEINLRDVD